MTNLIQFYCQLKNCVVILLKSHIIREIGKSTMENDQHCVNACEIELMLEKATFYRENMRILKAKTVRTNDNT